MFKTDGEVLKGDGNNLKSNGEVFGASGAKFQGEQKIYLNFLECRHFEHFGPTSKSANKSSSFRVVTSPLSILTFILCVLVYFQYS